MPSIVLPGPQEAPAEAPQATLRGYLWYVSAAYYIVAAQSAALLIFIADLRIHAQEQLAAASGGFAPDGTWSLASLLSLGLFASNGERSQQSLLASIGLETGIVSHLAWFLGWATVAFLALTIIGNADRPRAFSVGTTRRLIGVSLILLLVGLFAPLIVMAAQPSVPAIGKVVYKFQSKTVASGLAALFSSGGQLAGVLIALFAVAIPVARVIVTRAAVGNASLERRRESKKTLNAIGRWSMADAFVVAVFLACFAIGAWDRAAAVKPLWGFYFFAGYGLASMVVSHALGHIAPADAAVLPLADPKGARQGRPVAIILRAAYFAAIFAVGGYCLLYFTLGSGAAHQVAAKVVKVPVELLNSDETLRAHSTQSFPLQVEYAGTLTVEINVARGNAVTVSLAAENQTGPPGKGQQLSFLPEFSGGKSKLYQRSGRLAAGGYVLVVRDPTFGIFSASKTDIHIHARLVP